VLEINNVTSGYTAEVDIVSDVSIKVESSSVVCIIGPNGAGKSTLLKTIFGFLEPKRGEITFNGKSIKGLKPFEMIKNGLCYVPQERSVFPQLTVDENVVFGGWCILREREKLEKAKDKIYSMFPNLSKKRGQKATFLSGGEQRMLELARSMIVDPTLMLIDEPTAGLAPSLVGEVYDKIDQMKKEKVAVLLIDQNIREGIAISDYVYSLELGSVTHEGPSTEFKHMVRDLVKKWLIA